MDAAHPLGIAPGEVVVDRNDVNAFTGKAVEIAGQSSNQRFPFTGFHFSDAPFVQHHSADQLDIEVAHVQDAAASFAANGKGFDKEVVEGFAIGEALFEGGRVGGKFVVGKRFEACFAVAYGRNQRTHRLNLTVVLGAKKLGE